MVCFFLSLRREPSAIFRVYSHRQNYGKKKRFNLQAPPVYDRKVTNLFFSIIIVSRKINYGNNGHLQELWKRKKVRITSGIFWTLMGKNPIMEKSDAGAACLSWTIFFSIILSVTIHITAYQCQFCHSRFFFSSLAGKPNCHMHDSQPTSVNSQLSTFNHEGKQLKNIGTYIHTRIHPAALKSVHSSSRIWHQRMHERSWSIFSTHTNSSLSLIPKSIAPKQKMVVKLWCPSEKTRTGWFQYHLHPYTLT